jgi:hypothetical protein
MAFRTPKREQMASDIVGATMTEARSDRPTDPAHVIARMLDWRDRAHNLYDFIQAALGNDFVYDRKGKQRSAEELVQRAGISADQIPALDILRIERPAGALRAILIPRGLLIIGANGRLELRVLGPDMRQTQYFLVDKSQPLSGANNAAWYLIGPSDRLEPRPVTEELLREVIGASN